MSLSPCIAPPSGFPPAYLGLQLPTWNEQCDWQAACFRGAVADPSTYDPCVTAGAAAQATCVANCPQPEGDGGAAAFGDCQTSCSTTFEDCITGCGESPDPDCLAPCFTTMGTCMAACNAGYCAAQAAYAYVSDAAQCQASCCSTNTKNPAVCNAPCDDTLGSATVDAQSAYCYCLQGCATGYSDGVVIYDSDCQAGCQTTLDSAQGTANNIGALCNFDCTTQTGVTFEPCNTNRGCQRSCASNYQDAQLACKLALDADNDGDAYAECLNTALIANNGCLLVCCQNMLGKSPYETAANACNNTLIGCYQSASEACECDPTDAACLAAQGACIAAGDAICNTAYLECMTAAAEAGPQRGCAGCAVNTVYEPT